MRFGNFGPLKIVTKIEIQHFQNAFKKYKGLLPKSKIDKTIVCKWSLEHILKVSGQVIENCVRNTIITLQCLPLTSKIPG